MKKRLRVSREGLLIGGMGGMGVECYLISAMDSMRKITCSSFPVDEACSKIHEDVQPSECDENHLSS